MNCDRVLDLLYYSEESFSLVERILIYFHIRRCPKCAVHRRALQIASARMKEDFFPPAVADMSTKIMALIRRGTLMDSAKPEAIPFRAWVIAGLAMLVSLPGAYLGVDYLIPVDTRSVYFMLSLGITVGAVITAFGAMFIGCHMTELSKWLGLRPRQ
jgi:hypothetical protein